MFLRFELRGTRSARLQTDTFTFIPVIGNSLVNNSISCYKPEEITTINKQLFPKWLIVDSPRYIHNKTDRIGIQAYVCWIGASEKKKPETVEFYTKTK